MKEQTLEILKSLGKLQNVKKLKQPGEKKITLYSYVFDIKHLMKDFENLTATFMLVDQEDLITLIAYGPKKSMLSEDVYTQLNYANTQMLYGKFMIDDDGDLCWEYSFDPSKVNREDILKIFNGYVIGLIALNKWKEAAINEQ